MALLSFLSEASDRLNTTEYMRLVEKSDELIASEDWAGAEKALREALNLEPANPSNQLLLTNIGLVLLQQGKYGDAERHLDVALLMNPNSFIARKYRGMLRMQAQRLEEAMEDFNRAISLDSLDLSVRNLRGFLLVAEGDSRTASNDFLTVLEREPDNIEALEGLVECSALTDSPAQAVTFLNRLIDLDPKPERFFSRGMIFAKQGELSKASLDVQEGLKADPKNGNLYILRAYIEKISYRNNEARSSLEKAQRFGGDPEIIASLFPEGL